MIIRQFNTCDAFLQYPGFIFYIAWIKLYCGDNLEFKNMFIYLSMVYFLKGKGNIPLPEIEPV